MGLDNINRAETYNVVTTDDSSNWRKCTHSDGRIEYVQADLLAQMNVETVEAVDVIINKEAHQRIVDGVVVSETIKYSN